MTDRDALYRAILTNPDDDTPRLVYADWLEENERAEEAEFIRVQCQLEAAPPDHPQHCDLREREEELQCWLTTHAPGPTPRFPARLAVEGGPRWWTYSRRGFPQFLSFDGQNRPGIKPMRKLAASLEKAFARIPTRWLFVQSITLDQLTELLKQPVIAGLDRLTVQIGTDEPAAEDAAERIAACPGLGNLRGLALLFPVGDAGADALARSEHLSRLEWLAITADVLTPLAIRSLGSASWFRGVHNLLLPDGLNSDAFEELSRLGPFPRLHTLDLPGSAFAVAAWHVFARSNAFPRLTRMGLNDANLTDGRMAAFAGGQGLRLVSLSANSCAMGNEGARALVAAPWAESLQALLVANNRLGSTGVTAIARCRKLTELKHLGLAHNAIGVSGLRAIASNPALRGLTTLHLGGGASHTVTPNHVRDFLQKLQLPLLRHFGLSGWPIDAKAAAVLAGEKFANLMRLELADCKLTDAVARTLLASPTLQNLVELKLGDNRLKTGVKALTNRSVMPSLGACQLTGNRLDPDLARKLARRPGFAVDEVGPDDV